MILQSMNLRSVHQVDSLKTLWQIVADLEDKAVQINQERVVVAERTPEISKLPFKSPCGLLPATIAAAKA